MPRVSQPAEPCSPRHFNAQLSCLLSVLHEHATSLTETRDDADDLVQTTCEWVLLHPDRWPPNVPAAAWLLRVMRLIWSRELRVRARAGIGTLVPEQPSSISELTFIRRDVEWAIRQLPAARQALLLLVAEGTSYKDAAQLLGIPLGTVMSRLHRARLHVAALIEQGGRVRS